MKRSSSSANKKIPLENLVKRAVKKFKKYQKKNPRKNSPKLDRLYSWTECYEFFQSHLRELAQPDLQEDSPLLDEAVLRLAFYLASSGMYTRKAQLLQCSKNVLKKPLIDVFRLIGDNREEWLEGEIASNAVALADIDRSFSKSLVYAFQEANGNKRHQTHINTLKAKVYLGIFASIPAPDTLASKALRDWKAKSDSPEIQALTFRFDKKGFETWQKFGRILENITEFQGMEVQTVPGMPCPTMRKLDLILWTWGKAIPKRK